MCCDSTRRCAPSSAACAAAADEVGDTPADASTAVASASIPDCPAYPTLASMDGFFQRRCGGTDGKQTTCHGSVGAPFGSFSKPDVWKWALDKPAILTCTLGGVRFIDRRDPLQSLFWLKVAQPMPRCPDGSSANAVMPFADSQMIPPLTDDEKTCVRNFVTVSVGKAVR